MNELQIGSPNKEVLNAENKIAALFSIIVPGLGQVYKGHVGEGFLWMFLGMPVAIWAGILLGLATGGIGLLLPLVCWAALAVDAYYEKDWRKHHWFLPSDGDMDLDNVED
jgi:hypothetical protein